MNEIGVMIVANAALDFEGKFREAKESGLDSCQLSFWDPTAYTDEVAEKIRAALAATGFKISLLWAGWSGPNEWNFTAGPETLGIVPMQYRETRVAELKQAALFAKKIGVTDIATHAGFLPENPTDEAYEGVVSALREICAFYKENGINFLFETGQETPVTILRTIKKIGLDNVFINFDTANLILYGKGNPVDAVRVFGKYVRNTHIKDGLFPDAEGDGMQLGKETPVGEGLADIPTVLKMLKDLGYEGAYTIEREITGEEQKRDIEKTAKYLRELMGALA